AQHLNRTARAGLSQSGASLHWKTHRQDLHPSGYFFPDEFLVRTAFGHKASTTVSPDRLDSVADRRRPDLQSESHHRRLVQTPASHTGQSAEKYFAAHDNHFHGDR